MYCMLFHYITYIINNSFWKIFSETYMSLRIVSCERFRWLDQKQLYPKLSARSKDGRLYSKLLSSCASQATVNDMNGNSNGALSLGSTDQSHSLLNQISVYEWNAPVSAVHLQSTCHIHSVCSKITYLAQCHSTHSFRLKTPFR